MLNPINTKRTSDDQYWTPNFDPPLVSWQSEKAKPLRLLDIQLGVPNRLDSNCPKSHGAAAKHHICGIIPLAFELANRNNAEPMDWQSTHRFFAFVKLVEQSFASHRDVKFYANQMDCSHRTLKSRSIRE